MALMSETNGGGGPQRPGQSRLAQGANTPMAKTVALVVVAFIVGIVMVNIVGDDGGTAKTTKTTASTTPSSNSTTPSSTETTGGGKGTTTTVKASNTAI